MPFEPLVAESSQTGFMPLSEMKGFIPLESSEDKTTRLRGALPETLNFAGMDTGIPINEELSAYLTTLGAGISGSYRGAKQILGMDNGEEALNQANVNALSDIPGMPGGFATAGGFMGAGLDPVTLALPVGKAKSLLDIAKYGAIGGTAAGALQPVAESGSRVVNAAVGAGAGAVMAPAIGYVANRLARGARIPFRTPTKEPTVNVPTGAVAPAGEAVVAPVEKPPQQVVDEYMATIAGKPNESPSVKAVETPVGVDVPTIPEMPEVLKPPKVTSLLAKIKQMGGIDPSYAKDLTGESKMGAKGVPVGTFAKGTWEGGHGTGLDDLATRLHDEGWDIPVQDPDGGVSALTRMIQEELGGNKAYSFADQERVFAHEMSSRQWQEAQDFAAQAGIDKWVPKIEPAEARSVLQALGHESDGPSYTLADLTKRATVLNEAEAERLAIQSEGLTDAQYAKQLWGFINEHTGQSKVAVQATAGTTRLGETVQPSSGSSTQAGQAAAAEVGAGGGGQTGSINPSLAAKGGGAMVGATAGAVTADENAPPAEIASRALLGGLAGWQLAKFGSDRIGGIKIKPSSAVGNIPAKAAVNQPKPIEVIGDAAEPLLQKEMSTPLHKKITLLAKEYYAGGGERDPNILISDDIALKLATGKVAPEMASKYGITPDEISDIFRTSITDHARAMAYLSHVSRNINMTDEERDVIAKAGSALEDAAYVRPLWKKVTDTWRALLVTQPATAMRNAITQAGRIGLDVIQAPMDSWLQKLTGRPQISHPMDGLEEVMSFFQKNKENTDKILQSFPDAKKRMFQTYLSDVTAASGQPVEGAFWTGVNKVVDVANILNRTQEFVIRRVLFQTKLAQEMRGRGKDLAEIIKTNDIGAIPEDAIKAATKNALDKTFAETPAWGTMSKKLIDAVNSVPGASLAIPFPRFMYNAIKFQYEYSPIGILSYLSPTERAAFAQGDVQKVSKAVIGTAMLGAAFGIRNADNAGEKWYEWTKDNGDVVDLRPFNPFASYLFVADVLKRQRDGTLYKLSGSDIAQGLLSTNMRAGTGLYLLDNAVSMMSKSADAKKLGTKAKELTGDFLAGFFTPLNVLRDAYDQFTDGQSTLRDTRSEPILGPLKSRIPGVSQTLPEAELPTRAGPKITEDPLLRQATGITVNSPKNALESELDRLGFERSEILPSTGDHELDVKYAKAMGALAQKFLVPLADSSKYLAMSDETQGYLLHEVIGLVRREVEHTINQNLPPEKQREMFLKKQTPRLKYLLKEFGVMQ